MGLIDIYFLYLVVLIKYKINKGSVKEITTFVNCSIGKLKLCFFDINNLDFAVI